MRWRVFLMSLLFSGAAHATDTYTYAELEDANPPPPPTAGGLRLGSLLIGSSGLALGGTGYWLATKELDGGSIGRDVGTRLGGGMLLGTGVFLLGTASALTVASLFPPLKTDREASDRATKFEVFGGVAAVAGLLATCVGATQVGKVDAAPAYVLLASGMAAAGIGTGFLVAGVVVDRKVDERASSLRLRLVPTGLGMDLSGTF